MPEQDAVIAITSGSDDLQGILNIVWEHLLPAMKEGSLPPHESGLEQMNQKLQQLSIAYVEGDPNSPLASEVSGKTFHLEENDRAIQSISFNFEESICEITLTTDLGEQVFKAGYQSMEKGTMKNPGLVSDKVAVNGAWESEDSYAVELIYYETPESVKFTFKFEGNKLSWDTERKASFSPRHPESLKAAL